MTKQERKQEAILVSLCFILLVWVVFVANPFAIVAANPDAFLFDSGAALLGDALTYFLYTIIVLFLLYFLTIWVLKKHRRVRRFLGAILLAISLSVWLNSTFLKTDYGEFTGWIEDLKISPWGLLNSLQMGAFLFIFALALYWKQGAKVFINTVAAVFLISFLVTTIHMVAKISQEQIEQKSSDESFLTYSKNNPNLLYILLDEYQTDFFEAILDDQLKDDLRGFIWFKDAASNYEWTNSSTPAIFTGDHFSDPIGKATFRERVSEQSIARKLGVKGFETEVSSMVDFHPYLFPDNSFVSFYHLYDKGLLKYIELVHYSLFLSVPDRLKWLMYGRGDNMVTLWVRLFNNWDYLFQHNLTVKSYKILKYLAKTPIIVESKPSTFKFHHSILTHLPTVKFRDDKPYGTGSYDYGFQGKVAEGKWAVNKIINLIKNLKKAHIFDNTMIIISADHGSRYMPPSFDKEISYSRYAPLLLIKQLNRQGSFQISDFPAQLADLPKTIATAFNIPEEYPGMDLLSKNKPKQRMRRLMTHNYLSQTPGSINEKFVIDGPLKDPESWTRITPETLFPIEALKEINFSQASQSQYYYWTPLENQPRAEIKFTTTPDCQAQSIAFVLKSFLKPEIPQQKITVLINDKPVGEGVISSDQAEPQKITLPLPPAPDHHYTIRFEVDREEGLGFRFIAMELLLEQPPLQ